ncbi:hypothetical protein [Sphingomonas sp.]|uniref:hypothetical protein n=1 Tax=Sphingomonas sp. TaxID=28214 RepID=UPI0035B004BE
MPGRMRAALFLLIWFSCAWFGSWEFNPNNATRMFAAVAIVEDGSAQIDAFAPMTIDKAMFDGHAYLDKAPGMTLMALPAVWFADRVTGERAADHALAVQDPGFERYMRLRTRIAAATGPALLTAIAAVLLFDMALMVTGSAAGALFASLGYALGTPVWGWSTTIFGHAAVAALFVIAAWGGMRGGVRGLAVAGLALGWAAVVEYQAVLAGSVIAVWAIWRAWSKPQAGRAIAVLIAAGILALLPLLAYNLFAFGTVFRVGYSGVVGFEGMQQGLFGLTVPRMDVLKAILFSVRRGLIWVAPVLALAVPGLCLLVEDRRTRDVGIMAVGVVVIALLVNAAYVYWDGGNSTGPRHAMPLAGLAALGLAALWAELRSTWARVTACAVLALSIAINLVIASAEIMAYGFVPNALRDAVWRDRFVTGQLRTIPNEWWGWSPWEGLALWGVVAVPVIAALAWSVRRGRA